MTGVEYEFDPVERFVAGTVGEPGARTFFLQARGLLGSTGKSALTSVSLEKQQVQALAERVDEMLDEVVRRSGGTAPVPAVAPVGSEDLDPMDTPIEEEFRVGTMSLVWDDDRGAVVIECFSIEPSDVGEEGDPAADPGDDPADDPDAEVPAGTGGDRSVLRVTLAGGAARSFTRRALALVAAGRPPCPFCLEPLDPQGHVCPRANGYRR